MTHKIKIEIFFTNGQAYKNYDPIVVIAKSNQLTQISNEMNVLPVDIIHSAVNVKSNSGHVW